MSSRKTKSKATKKRAQRATSNVFAMFDQAQIQEFKEAFNMIDQNRDGFIDKEDLADMLASLGTDELVLHWVIKCQISQQNHEHFVYSTKFKKKQFYQHSIWIFSSYTHVILCDGDIYLNYW